MQITREIARPEVARKAKETMFDAAQAHLIREGTPQNPTDVRASLARRGFPNPVIDQFVHGASRAPVTRY